MAYASWSVVFGEQPSAAKWNILGTNDSYFDSYIDRTGFPIQIVNTSTSTAATGTTAIPYDDTIPQITEGDQYMTLAVTPTSTTSKLLIDIKAWVSFSVASKVIVGALFQDATANALAGTAEFQSATGGSPTEMNFNHSMTAGTTSSTTFRFRAGQETGAGGTLTFNGQAGTRKLGGVTLSSITITEYRA